jgi:hypothetical protein
MTKWIVLNRPTLSMTRSIVLRHDTSTILPVPPRHRSSVVIVPPPQYDGLARDVVGTIRHGLD